MVRWLEFLLRILISRIRFPVQRAIRTAVGFVAFAVGMPLNTYRKPQVGISSQESIFGDL